MPTYDQSLYQVAIVVSAVLFGFLLLVIFPRLHREAEGKDPAQKSLLPWADAAVIFIGLPTLSVGGLMLPLMGIMLKTELLQGPVVALTGFGIVVAAFYPLAAVSHYGFSVGRSHTAEGRRIPTAGEAFMVCVSLVVAIAWMVAMLK